MDDAIKKSLISVLDTIPFTEAIAAKEILREADNPETTLKLAAAAAAVTDSSVLKILNQFDRKRDCQEGCSYCCRIVVETTIPEVLAIAQYIRDNFAPRDQEVLLRSIDTAINETKGMSGIERFDARVACPLLKDDCCSVYDVRPVSCRSYHSYDVETCRRDFLEPKARHTVDYNNLAVRVGPLVGIGMNVALNSKRLDGRSVELARGLKIALEDPTLVSTWRSRPHAFDEATMNRAHPDQKFDSASAKRQKDFYRAITNSPQWKAET
jgi:uncharacterized protein